MKRNVQASAEIGVLAFLTGCVALATPDPLIQGWAAFIAAALYAISLAVFVFGK